jgi:predicted transcriptional regulator
MEVRLDPELQSRLTRLASERGADAEVMAREAIERFVDYDAWFLAEVDKSVLSADRGELVSHEEVGTRIRKLLAEKQFRS